MISAQKAKQAKHLNSQILNGFLEILEFFDYDQTIKFHSWRAARNTNSDVHDEDFFDDINGARCER